MALLRALPLLLLVGCFAPQLDGKFACGKGDACPAGLSCIHDVCRQSVAKGPGVDASTDGATAAATTADAATAGDAATRTDAATTVDAGEDSKKDAATESDAATAKTDASQSCQPASCGQGACGTLADGCGATLACGGCPSGQLCGAVQANTCSAPPCAPSNCQQEKAHCGQVSDGCGKVLDCGACPNGKPCGQKKPNQCG